MLTGEIRNQIDSVWNAFHVGGVTNPISVIEQISYLLFIKRLDDIQNKLDNDAVMAKMLGDAAPNKKPVFTDEEKGLRWRSFRDADPEKMFELVRDKVFPKIKTLGGEDGSFAQHMKDAIFMIPRSDVLDQVVQLIDGINMDDKDTKGDVYEYMLSKLQSSGVNGQFRTPRHIIKMMVELMQPKLEDTICDPACGTCGFLMSSEEYVSQTFKKELGQEKHKKHFNDAMFTGFDFDQHMLRIGAMNMMLHGIENPTVEYRDSLSDDGDNNISEAFSLILANPPFQGSVNYDAIAPDLLKALGKTAKKKVTRKKEGNNDESQKKVKQPTEKSELLFLALMLRMLKKGGRAAVIVPDGILFSSNKANVAIRKTIVEDQMLEAVISMPSGVFKPYAGVSTAILIFTRTDSGGTNDVWFYDMKADGYSLDDKRAETKESDIADILKRWKDLDGEEGRQRTDQSFMVPKNDIKDEGYDLSINRYKEMVYEEIEYDKPKAIINRIKILQKSMTDGVKLLESLV